MKPTVNGVWKDQTNFTMLTDFYELTMSQGYLDAGLEDQIVYFDLYFRHVPENGGYALMAGVEQMIDYLENLNFSADDIAFLRSTGQFSEKFLKYLEQLKFTCDVWAIPEGTPLFPNEPLVKVRGPIMQAQMIETMLLLTINHQSLIATKAARIVRAAKGRPVFEFGARRAQGYDASVFGARAAYIGGAHGTSCTIVGQRFGIPLAGTMAHSFVQLFDDEFEAFAAYARSYPKNTILLVDTYDTLRSGIPNAIRCAREVLEPAGHRLRGIRIDSGDLTYLTQEARRMLDEAGLEDCKITISNALDEYLIRDLLQQGAAADSFGVGERLITSRAEPVFGGVYKLSAVETDDGVEPRMKISENLTKVTNPGNKEVWRFYDRDTGKALADLITLAGEEIDPDMPYEIFDPIMTWKRKVLTNFTVRPLLVPIFEQGRLVMERRSIDEIRDYATRQLDTLWESVKRFENPQTYYVDLSQKLWDMKQSILDAHGVRHR
ncbi:MAG: nicotinate phosphoribosyltransferase [Bacillota bacterium]|nr:nicotinate phosphoribosyltransferase [Bacillota bacterium]